MLRKNLLSLYYLQQFLNFGYFWPQTSFSHQSWVYILAAVTTHTGDCYSCQVTRCVHRKASDFRKNTSKRLRESLINTFLPAHGEHCIWVTVWSPDPLQLWEVNCKTKEVQRWFRRSVSLLKDVESPLFISLEEREWKEWEEQNQRTKLKGLCIRNKIFQWLWVQLC